MSNAILTQFGIWPDAFRIFWFELLFGSTLILLAAGVICLCLSRATAALRCRVWALAMIGLLCFPMISLCVPRMSPTFLAGNFSAVNHTSLQESEFDTLPDAATAITPEIITDINASAESMELTPVDHEILSRQTQLNAENAVTPSELPVIAAPIETEGMATLPEPPHALDANASSAELPPLADENMLFAGEHAQEQSMAIWPTLMLVWFGGMAIACMMLLRSWLVSRYVFRAATLPDNPAWQREVDAISEKIGLRRTVIALICPSTSVPFVAGFGKGAVNVSLAL